MDWFYFSLTLFTTVFIRSGREVVTRSSGTLWPQTQSRSPSLHYRYTCRGFTSRLLCMHQALNVFLASHPLSFPPLSWLVHPVFVFSHAKQTRCSPTRQPTRAWKVRSLFVMAHNLHQSWIIPNRLLDGLNQWFWGGSWHYTQNAISI